MIRTRKKVSLTESRATRSGPKKQAPGLESPGAWSGPVRSHRSRSSLINTAQSSSSARPRGQYDSFASSRTPLFPAMNAASTSATLHM
jgi:hypothetical protein